MDFQRMTKPSLPRSGPFTTRHRDRNDTATSLAIISVFTSRLCRFDLQMRNIGGFCPLFLLVPPTPKLSH